VSTGIYKDASAWGAGWYTAIGGNDSYPTEWYQFRYGNLITHSYGYLNIAGSTRSPVFYDLDDTGYYLDPNTTGTALRIRGQIFAGPNSSGRYTRFGGDGGATDEATVSASNGNLHIDSKAGFGLYLNHYSSGDIISNNGGGIFYNYTQMRTPFIYDYNNTAYYLDPNNTTNLNILAVNSLTVGGATPLTTAYYPWTSNRDFTNGTLVQTSIPMPDYGDPWVIEITGNSYDTNLPWSIQGQGYIYSATNINVSFISNGRPISGLQVIRYGGNLCFWWPRNGYWQGFTVKVYVPYATFPQNRVTSITDTGLPGGYDRALTPTIYQSYNTYNQAN
jgi:hypothetical protein